MDRPRTIVVAIVGVDGSGKSATWEALLRRLAPVVAVAGVGEQVLSGHPGEDLHPRSDIPLRRPGAIAGWIARRTRRMGPYRWLKLVDLIGRARLRDAFVGRGRVRLVLTDGDPLINSAAWSAARFHRTDLADDDALLLAVVDQLSGVSHVPRRELRRYLRRAPELALLERLHLLRFAMPDLVLLLEIDGASAMARIRARGRPLQSHEDAGFLDALGAAYERVCGLLESARGLDVVRIPVAGRSLDAVVTTAEVTIGDRLARERAISEAAAATAAQEARAARSPDAIHVIATTMSGSLRDQRRVGGIGAAFRGRTARPIAVHVVDSHAEARRAASTAVASGVRTLVSAGGAGTFNAVLEGCHGGGGVPLDLRLAFLRKGSADLIGKALHIPDDLDTATAAIVGGLEDGRDVPADILGVAASGPDGAPLLRHLIGFGGFGVFGDVPRFTESRFIKLYKGILGTLLGDYGPFYMGLSLATLRWLIERALRRTVSTSLVLDGDVIGPRPWVAVIVVNGDLGPDFPLGRGLGFASGTFRVIAIPDRGILAAIRALQACRSARIVEDPAATGAVVRAVRTLEIVPVDPERVRMVNVDGLRMLARGPVHLSVTGRIVLVEGRPAG